MNTLRKLMEAEMYDHLLGNDVNESSRYRGWFYEPADEATKAGRRFNEKHKLKYNVLTLGAMSDEDFFNAYRVFARRYNTWM